MSEEDLKVRVSEEMLKKVKGLKEFIEFWDKDFRKFSVACIKGGLPLYLELSQFSDAYKDVVNFKVPDKFTVNEEGTNSKQVEKRMAKLKKSEAKSEQMLYRAITRKNAYNKECDRIYEEADALKIVDFTAIHFISEFLFNVDSCIKEYKNPGLFMIKMYTVFGDENYFEIAYSDNHDCDEEKNYREFAKKLEHSIELLKDVT
tara:strand:- start:688 stop:1296 length:609 start_codon:yes stop_codon:yes gene_type:complete